MVFRSIIPKIFGNPRFPTNNYALQYSGGIFKKGKDASPYARNLTFSGCDIVPVVYGLDRNGIAKLHVIGDIATITYSIHQDKGAVRTLGRTAPRGFVRGPETIAGTMIFNVFNHQALWELNQHNKDSTGHSQHMHRLPSFDIILYFSDEAGHEAKLAIFGVQMIDEGQSHSVEDTYVENTANFVAMSVQPLEPVNSTDPGNNDPARRDPNQHLDLTGTPYLQDYNNTLISAGERQAFDYSYLPKELVDPTS